MPGKSRSSIRPRLFSLWMIVTLLIQASLPVTAQALPLAAPDPAEQARPLNGIFLNCATVTGISEAECNVLVELYNQTGGDSWDNRTGWLSTDTPCEWFGVACTGGNVSMISLASNNLDGSLPGSLWTLTNLETLNLSENLLSGDLPAGLGQLTSLQYLHLNSNGFTGPIPVEIGNLDSLQVLQLQGNNLSGNLPNEIGGLTSLQLFYMNNNDIDGEFPASIVNLTQLTEFAFDCVMTSSDPAVIAFIDSIVPGWQNEICLPPGSIVSISGNAGAANVQLAYFDDGSLQTLAADGNGDYSFEVTYGWNGTVTPSLTGFYFTPGCRDYEANPVIGNRIQQNFIAVPNPPIADTTGNTSRASLDSSEIQGNCTSTWSSSSTDGRYIAFASDASNLVAGDTNGLPDVFVRDTQNGTTTRVSIASDGSQGNGISGPSADQGYSSGPSISGDGRYVAFNSTASNLVDGDTNSDSDVFVYDLQNGTTTRVSVASGGSQGNGDSLQPAISANGRYIAFNSRATNLVADDTNETLDVFVHDQQSGTTTRVSVAWDGSQGNNSVENWKPSISGDGRYVAFTSEAGNLVAVDENGRSDIFVRDLLNNNTLLISKSSAGIQTNGFSTRPSISQDGTHVTFASTATNLVSQPVNNTNAYVHNLSSGETTLVSADISGDVGVGPSLPFSISADGRYVAFDSFASTIVAPDTNGKQDTFVRDMQTGRTVRVSVDSNGNESLGDSYWPALSANARFVSFSSQAANLVANDINGVNDIFVVNHAALSDPPAAFSKTSPPNPSTDQNTSPTLEWEASFSAANYEYCYDTSDDSDCAAWIDNQGATSVTLNNLTPGSTYYWHVRANSIGGTTYSNGSETNFWSFTIPCYSLQLNALPPWGGAANASAPNCNGNQYAHGTLVTVTGVPNTGYGFVSWSGDVSSTENPLQVSITAPTTLNAQFTETCFSLSTIADPETAGTVEASPAPNCPGDPSRYLLGTMVTLTANAASGFTFSAWGGDIGGTTNPTTVEITGNLFIMAAFAESCYTLTTSANPLAGGDVSASPAPNCASDPLKYHTGTVVTLTANANAGYAFTSWSGDASGSISPVDITLDADKTVSANFSNSCFSLATQANPLASGTVETTPTPNCPGDPTRYAAGTTVTLTATPATGYVFTSWSGDASGATNPTTVVMSTDRAVTANFDLACFTLTTAANPTVGGSVEASPTPNCNGSTQYTYGTLVTLTATPATGYLFTSWSGSASGATNPTTVTMTADRSVTANFGPGCFTLTSSANPAAGGSVDASPAPNCNNGTQYSSGTLVTLTAIPSSGYAFSSWSGSATGTTNPATVTMSANRTVTANFTAACYTLTVTPNPSAGGTVSASPAPNCSGGTQYSAGTVVTLTATARAGYKFSTWSGSISGTANPTAVTMNGNRSVTANFTQLGAVAVASITRLDPDPTSKTRIKYAVTFTEHVKGVDVEDFELTTYGLTRTNIISVYMSDEVYTVTVASGEGNGVLRLDLVDNDTILDGDDNPLGGVGAGNGDYRSGEVYYVHKGARFVDVPTDHWAWAYVESLYNAGVTSGCWDEPPYYCPDTNVTRAQMAVFLLRAKYGSTYAPVAATGTYYLDVPKTHWAAAWIEQLGREGVTGGCGEGNFCPDTVVTREQMAVFLLRTKYGPTYTPPAATGMFKDVPKTYWAAPWIEELARQGITGGCGGGKYCPKGNINRAQMAVFILQTFELPMLWEFPQE